MLAGLFFLGVIAATAMPDLIMGLRGSSDDDSEGPEDDDQTEVSGDASLLESDPDVAEDPEDDPAIADTGAQDDEAVDPVDDDLDLDELDEDTGDGSDDDEGDDGGDPGEGADLVADPQPGLTLIEDFQPGSDTLTIVIPDSAEAFDLSSDAEAGTSSLSYESDMGLVEVRFEGLGDVPVNDIFLRISDAASATGYADIALSTVIEGLETPGDEGEAAPIGPEDPEIPDTQTGGKDDDEPVLTPEDPEVDEGPGLPADVDAPVVQPVVDDIAPEPAEVAGPGGFAGEAQFVLSPAQEDTAPAPSPTPPGAPISPDTGPDDAPLAPVSDDEPAIAPDALLRDAGHPGHGEPEADGPEAFWLSPDAGGAAVAEVSGFTPGEDLLQISLNGAPLSGPGVLSVVGSPDGLDSLVQIDGVTMAVLKGAPGAGIGDIVVETRPDIFA